MGWNENKVNSGTGKKELIHNKYISYGMNNFDAPENW